MAYNYSPRKIKGGRGGAFFVSLTLVSALLGGAGVVYSIVRDLPNPERFGERSLTESTKIYDRTGKILLYEVHGDERRTVVSLSDIPERVRQATLVAEDINFYRHYGLDWQGIGRAIIKNVSSGDFSQGGSTITQQLIKNSLLGSQKTIRRKLKEQIMALLIERKYSKDEIFGFYLNQVPYGSNAYGVATAARLYFGKEDVGELTLPEAATLAALLKAPSYYSPYGSHKDELMKRKDWILQRMADAEFVSLEEAEQARRAELAFVPLRETIRAPHFVQFVREYLDQKYGKEFVERGGLKVITTLDWTLQEEAEKIIREGAETNEKSVKAYNASLVAIDPRSGEILSMVGSKDYLGKPQPEGCAPGVNCRFDPYVNIATRGRQPGSAFKPFVYATAFKKGYTPETVLFDVPTEFNPLCNPDGSPGPQLEISKYRNIECYHPKNYDDKFRGPVSMRQAIAQSLNLPSVKTLYLAGISDSIKTATDLGITTLTEPERYGLSLVLGGAEVTLLEMTSAFGVFAQDGIRHPAGGILRVEDRKGSILEERRDTAVPAMDTQVARLINDVLSDNASRVPVFSPHSSLYFPGRPVAAKTGTTQFYNDAWTIGYTPSLVAGVWVGNNDNAPMRQGGVSVMVAGPIWHRFMEFALSPQRPEYFTPAEGIRAAKPILAGVWRSGETIKIDKISRKLATAYTPAELIEEIAIGGVDSILARVRRDDPSGDPPTNPGDDPQFGNWQAGIDQWLRANPMPPSVIPVEADDLHTPEKAPRIILISPAEGVAEVSGLSQVLIRVETVFALSEVSLFVDDALAHAIPGPILSSDLGFRIAPPLTPGPHRIKITAYDAVGNKSIVEHILVVNP